MKSDGLTDSMPAQLTQEIRKQASGPHTFLWDTKGGRRDELARSQQVQDKDHVSRSILKGRGQKTQKRVGKLTTV